jgi:thiol:disulfide interchange protein DsbG
MHHPTAPARLPPALRRATGVLLQLAIGAAFMGAAVAAPASKAAYPKVLQKVLGPSAKVVKQFPAVSGLTGWVLEAQGQHSLVYTTADNKTLISGELISEEGIALSRVYTDQHVPKPDYAALYDELARSAYVAEGELNNPKFVTYAIVDPNCTFCHLLWRAFQPYEKIGLQVRWVLVSTLGPTSMPKAIGVLNDPDQRAALLLMEQSMNKPFTATALNSEQGNPKIAAMVKANGVLLQRFGLNGTPGTVWKDKQGKVMVKNGMMNLPEIAAMSGLPLQPNNDPDLARFAK